MSFNHRQGERASGKGRAAPAPLVSESESQYDKGRSVLCHDGSDHFVTFLHLKLKSQHHGDFLSLQCGMGDWQLKEGRGLKRTSVAASGSA